MESNFIDCQINDGIAVLSLDDPSANTLTYHLLQELEQRFQLLECDPDVRGVVITGQGEKFFSGGVNIGMLLTAGKLHNSHFILYAVEVLDYIANSELPVLAAINGNITGGGLELALISDLRVAVEGEYNIGFPEVRLGVIPGMGGTQRLSRLIGPQLALELITQGRFITPAYANTIGLVDQVLPADQFKSCAVEVARERFANREVERRCPDKGLTSIINDGVIKDIVSLRIEKGVAKISLLPAASNLPALCALMSINDAILSARSDEDVHTLLLNLNEGGIAVKANEEQPWFIQRYLNLLISRIDTCPRIFSLVCGRALNHIEIEVAMACDYRFFTGGDLGAFQYINNESPSYYRYEKQLSKLEKAESSIAQLVESGFFKTRPEGKASDWYMELIKGFTPSTGASQAIGYAKLAVNKGSQVPLEAGLLLERHLQEQLFAAVDSEEGMKSYLEKRSANFKGGYL